MAVNGIFRSIVESGLRRMARQEMFSALEMSSKLSIRPCPPLSSGEGPMLHATDLSSGEGSMLHATDLSSGEGPMPHATDNQA